MTEGEKFEPTSEEIDKAYKINDMVKSGEITPEQASKFPGYRPVEDLKYLADEVKERAEARRSGDYQRADAIKRDLENWFELALYDLPDEETAWTFKEIPPVETKRGPLEEKTEEFERIEYIGSARTAKEKGWLINYECWMGVGLGGYNPDEVARYAKWMSENFGHGYIVIPDIPTHIANHEAELGRPPEGAKAFISRWLRSWKKASKFGEAVIQGDDLVKTIWTRVKEMGLSNISIHRWADLDLQTSAHLQEVSGIFRKFRAKNPWFESDLYSVAEQFETARQKVAKAKDEKDKEFRKHAVNTYVLEELALTAAFARGRHIIKVGRPRERHYDRLAWRIFTEPQYKPLAQEIMHTYPRRDLPPEKYLGFIYLASAKKEVEKK